MMSREEYKKYYSDDWGNEVNVIKIYSDDGQKPDPMYAVSSTIDGHEYLDWFTYYSDALGTFNNVVEIVKEKENV